jgi:hypothetical protein
MKYIQGLKVVVRTIRPEINLNIKTGSPTIYKDIVHDVQNSVIFFKGMFSLK